MTHGTHNAESDSRNQNIKIYINGDFFQRQDAKISVFDSGYLVGDGVWEGIRLYKGKLAFVNDHLTRLWTAAKAIGLDIPYSQDEIIKRIQSTVEINNMFDQVHVRVMLTRGIKKRLHRIQGLPFLVRISLLLLSIRRLRLNRKIKELSYLQVRLDEAHLIIWTQSLIVIVSYMKFRP